MVARRLPAHGDGRESGAASLERDVLGRVLVVAKVHLGTMPYHNRSEQREFAFDPINDRNDPRGEEVWAIVDSNHGPPPYQSGALTD